ncbi:DUF2799 domain-containing protein [Photobacterium rosenbergii]|uniref:DUF2799 domain-containing protein n=1 Tax=Photobacterium rosenbergii TaxID=294936 RepID=A0ABU3ZND5_9GAMM|nr:DUF2799 domain-containing protein [Photobacterium rosenbergii]MDV5171607.1 DUF2799 domain-containing protein [Photobacterium rosenbergii]
MKFLTLILSLYIISGCSSSLSEQAMLAQTNDWYRIGLLDGEKGHYQQARVELEDLGSISEEEYQKYKQGFSDGLDEYCKPDNAQRNGSNGVLYQGQCTNTEFEELAIQKWQEAYIQSATFESMVLALSN